MRSATSYPGTPTFTGTHTQTTSLTLGCQGVTGHLWSGDHTMVTMPTTGPGRTDLAFNPSLAAGTCFWITIQSTVTATLFPRQRRMAQFLLLFSIDAVDPRSPQQGVAAWWAEAAGRSNHPPPHFPHRCLHLKHRQRPGRRPPLTPLFRSWSAAQGQGKSGARAGPAGASSPGATRAGQAKRATAAMTQASGSLSAFTWL